MQKEIIFAANVEDLPYIQQLSAARNIQVLCVLPHVHEVTLRAGFLDAILVDLSNPSWQMLGLEEQDTYLSLNAFTNLIQIPPLTKQARQAHLAFNEGLDALLSGFLEGATIGGWLPIQLAHFLHNALGYRRIWAEIVPRYSSGFWHVLVPNQPYCLGNHSCLASLLLADQLSQSGMAYSAYETEIPGLGEGQFPDLKNISPKVDLLCHIPTCFYDKEYFYDEIERSGLSFGILTSEVFDAAPDTLPASGLCSLQEMLSQLNPADIERVYQLEVPVTRFLQAQLADYIPLSNYRNLQTRFWWECIRNQCFFFLWLNQYFSAKKPGQFLLSNHDAMQHGALLSFAKLHNIPVTIVPHSKVFNYPFFYDNPTNPPLCLHHGLQDGPCVDTAGKVLPGGRLTFAGSWSQDPVASREIQTLGIVLNGVHLIAWAEYMKGLLHIQRWCQEQNVRLRLRSRTGIPMQLISQTLRMSPHELQRDSQGSVLDFAPGCDILVSYDLHSSAVIELVREGYACVHADLQPEMHGFWCTVDAMVVPRFRIAELLERLTLMKADPTWFRAFRSRQHQAALDTQVGAQPLGVWLRRQHVT